MSKASKWYREDARVQSQRPAFFNQVGSQVATVSPEGLLFLVGGKLNTPDALRLATFIVDTFTKDGSEGELSL